MLKQEHKPPMWEGYLYMFIPPKFMAICGGWFMALLTSTINNVQFFFSVLIFSAPVPLGSIGENTRRQPPGKNRKRHRDRATVVL